MGMGTTRMGGMIVGLRFDLDLFQFRWTFHPVGCWLDFRSCHRCSATRRIIWLCCLCQNAAKQTRTVRDSTESSECGREREEKDGTEGTEIQGEQAEHLFNVEWEWWVSTVEVFCIVYHR